jgi:hypothetical protein
MDESHAGIEFSRNPTLDDLVELCRHLNAAGAKYIVIGGFALIHYGFVRGTGDIDLLVDHSEQNIVKIQQGLMYLPDQAAKDLNLTDVKDYHVVRVADEIVVDLIEKACDITYQQARDHIVYETINNVAIPFLSIEWLVKTKQSYREKDIIDRRFLEAIIKLKK